MFLFPSKRLEQLHDRSVFTVFDKKKRTPRGLQTVNLWILVYYSPLMRKLNPNGILYPIDFIAQTSTPHATTTATTILIGCSHRQCSRRYSSNLVHGISSGSS